MTENISLMKAFNLTSVVFLCVWCSSITATFSGDLIQLGLLVGIVCYGLSLRWIGTKSDVVIGGYK